MSEPNQKTDPRASQPASPALFQFREELKRTHATVELAAESAGLGIWTWYVDSGFLDWDKRMFKIYEVPQEIIDKGLLYEFWAQSVHPEDVERASGSLEAAVAKGAPWHEEFRLLLPDGRIKHIKASAVCIIDQETKSTTVIGANLDITSEKQLQEKLAEKSRIAEQHSLAKSQFLANMSHELRTPMNAILGIGDLLQATELTNKQSEYLEMMMGSATKLLDLLNDILDLSKIEAGELNIEKIAFPLEEVIVDALKGLAATAHEKGLDFHFQKRPAVPVWVNSDPIRLTQIIINLVNNAIKFTSKGEINVVVFLDENQPQGDENYQVEIMVSDTGIGIAKDKIETIFAPFSQADGSTTRKYGGTGLGLSIVAQLVKLLKGTITIESELEKGTQITVSLPFQAGPDNSKDFSTSDEFNFLQGNSQTLLSGKNTLVIESHDINREWITEILHSWHCNVTACVSPQEAYQALESASDKDRTFDFAIIDRDFDGVSAFEIGHQIVKLSKQQKREAPKFILLKHADQITATASDNNQISFDAYVTKPIKQSELFAAIVSALNNEEVTNKHKESIQPIADHEALSILIAEDQPVNQFLIKEIMEKRGHQFKLVNNGREACDAVLKDQFDVILMDVQMPVMDGIDATKTIRSVSSIKQPRIIGLTARALKEDSAICLNAGMDFYVTKPFQPQQLLDVIEQPPTEKETNRNNSRSNNSENSSLSTAADEQSETASASHRYQIFSLNRGLESTGGDHELLIKILELSAKNCEQYLTQLNSNLDKFDDKQLAQKIHQIKGMLANFCKEEIIDTIETTIQNLEANHEVPKTEITKIFDWLKLASQELTQFLAIQKGAN